MGIKDEKKCEDKNMTNIMWAAEQPSGHQRECFSGAARAALLTPLGRSSGLSVFSSRSMGIVDSRRSARAAPPLSPFYRARHRNLGDRATSRPEHCGVGTSSETVHLAHLPRPTTTPTETNVPMSIASEGPLLTPPPPPQVQTQSAAPRTTPSCPRPA